VTAETRLIAQHSADRPVTKAVKALARGIRTVLISDVTISPDRRGRLADHGTGGLVHRAASSGLLGKLMAEVRSEFRGDVLEFGAAGPVFGGTDCRVAGCGEPHADEACVKSIGNGGTTKDARATLIRKNFELLALPPAPEKGVAEPITHFRVVVHVINCSGSGHSQ
jgi:hypothetical protein